MRGDNMDNNQMRAMYNSFGTLNRPQSFGDDLYNDKENLMPASPELTQTGTDEAGNPIMAPVNMPEAPQNDNPILDNVIEYASNAGPAAGMPGPVGTIMDMTMPFITGNEEQRQQVVDRIRSYATPQGWERGIKSVIHSMSNATELEHTKLYENYFYNAEKKNEEVKRIANILHIDGNTFAHNRELYQKAALAADRVERLGKFKKYQDAEGNIDMAKIYADTPGLAEVQQKYGTAAAALALGNIDGIRSINEVYDNAFSRFAGSVYAGARRGWIADRRAAIWNDARKENRLPTTEEQARLDEYAAELNALPKYNYNTAANVAGAMIGGAMENMAMILKSQGAGAVAGLAAGRLGGVKAGEIARNAASTYIMAQQIAGSQYEELVNKTDAQGRPMYTPEQASWLALAQGYGEAVLEQYSLNQIGKAIFGRSAAKSLTEIIKSSPTLEAAKAGVRDYAALKLREAGKAGFISLGAEAFEEFTQSASDMLMENMAQIMLKGKDADTASIDEILTASTGQMLEALPAIGGFGLIGLGMNPIANTRAVLGFRSNVRNVVNSKIIMGRMANAHYNEVLTGVWKNKGNIKELENKAPETVTTILDVQNRAAGMEDGFVDIKNLSQQENGMEMVRQIAEQNNISDDELRACMDGSGMLQVKTSTLMQMDLKDEQHKKLLDNITTSLDAFTSAQETNAIKIAKEQMDSLQKFNDKTYKAAVDNIIAARFPDAEQAKLAREIIEANYDNPQEEFKRRLDAVNAEMDEYIGPVLQELKSGMKQGVDIIRIEGGKDGRDDTYRKQSNNADWYRNYFADYGRAPNAEELRGLAIDIASGRQDNRYGLMDYQNNTDETRAYFAPVAETLDRLEEERNALLAIQDRMRNLNPGEMVATAALSKDALRVYDNLIAMMGESENKNVRKAGKLNALLMARYADNMAKVISRIRQQPYTAADFARDRFKLDVNAIYDAAMQDAAQMFQVSPAEFARQKKEVRKQYEGTDSWMIAPDGSETNLTEDQWITVRTPAFKNWFGDWENDPANASKVLDENGEPLVVYHGTVAGEFDTFDRSYGSIESDMGNGFYFTNNRRDVKNNYEGGGPDFENKVARLAERIESEEEIDYEEAEGRARAELFTASNLFNVFLNIRYPAYVESTTILQDEAEAEEVKEEDYEDEDAFYEAQNEAVENAWSDMIASIVDRVEYDELMDDTSALSNLLWESIYNGGIEIAALKEQINNLYPEDAEGNLSGNEILRIVIDELGYDGIIDETVSEKFRGMDLSPDTTHYIAFKPAQIKDATGRNVGFDPEKENIYLQKETERNNKILERQKAEVRLRYQNTDEWLKAPNGKKSNLTEDQWITVRTRSFKRWFGNWETDKENASKLLDENGEPKVFYHGTGADFDTFDISYLGAASGDAGWFGKGFYFAFSENEARMYNDRRIIAAFLNMRNPFDFHENMTTYNGYNSNLYGTGEMAFILNLVDKFPELAKNQNIEASEEGFIEKIPFEDFAKTAKDVMENTEFKVEETTDEYTGEKTYLLLADLQEEKFTDSEGNERTYKYYNFQRKFLTKEDAGNKLNQTYLYLKEVIYDGYMELPRTPLVIQDIDFKGAVLKDGYDGIIQSKYGDEAVAFEPNQIKDASGRNIGFDPKSGNIYYQQQGTAKGAISFTQDGQRFIRLFETADQSTFIHEMAHMFLLDLQEIAGIDPNSQQAKDLQTIMAWAQYKPGQADEYKGTASAAEFLQREAAIKDAEAKGDTTKATALKNAWAQERFARAFEEYLRTGEAPAQGLKRAFRQFKKWLVQIYNDVIGAGVRATPEVEAIMARMVASEDEIDAMEAANSIARLKELDPDILTEDAQATRDRWQAEAKEQAKEKLLKELMKLYRENNLKDIDKRLEDVRAAAQAEVENVPCFVCEKLLADGTDMESALEITGFDSEQDYKDALAAAGGSMTAALDNVVKQAKENMLTAMPGKAQLYSMAEEALLSGDYNTRLSELEAELMRAREKKYENIPARLRKAFTDMDAAITNFETEAVRSAVQKLKYAERWGAKEFKTINELESYLAKMESQEEAQDKLIEKFNKRYDELKQATVRNQQWIRGVRDATLGHARVLQSAAVFRLAEESVSVATNVRYWHRQALAEAKKAWDNIARAQRRGEETDYNASVQAKQQQAVFDAMTAQAIKNRKTVDKWLNGKRDGFMARGKRMADPKVKANADMRYFHNHLLYIFGLRSGDATPPVNYKEFTALLSELRASHQFEDDVPAWLIAAAEQDEPGKNYQQLTMGELEELYKLTRILYRLAVNDKGLLTMDVDMDTVVAECVADWHNNVDYEVGNQRINEVKGAIGDYMNDLLKPEVLLSMLGGKQGAFVKYIYRVLFNAAEAEEKAREAEARFMRGYDIKKEDGTTEHVKGLYERYYTKEELRAMVNDSVMVDGPDGKKVKLQIGADADITKENLICMALNWGNEANRARLTVGLFDCENETELAVRQAQLMDILRNTLTEKDWNFVQTMWDHINTFAKPVSEVMEKSVGVPLDRVKADAFDVDLPDGKVIRLAGGYYPIVKDSSKSTRQSEFEQMEEAKALGGVSVFGTGMSATKQRADSLFLNQGPLKLTLDVANNHITAQIHLINAKMAVRDAYKVINNKTIQGMIKQTCGDGTVKTMNDWVLNCWAPPIRPRSWYESVAASLRSKTVGAIMGYRVSTALLNAANVVYMAQEIGTKNALAAMVDFYRHPIENRREILDISVFMRNRASNMDRDLSVQNEQILKRHNAVGNAIDKATGGRSEDLRYQMGKYANWLIEQTDMMVSLPLYRWQFMETYNVELEKGVSEEEARETANYEATRRVTKVFGSSRAVDSSAVQRSKKEMVKLITPFFSFANTMMNAVWSKYYEGKYKGSERIEKLDANGNPVLNEDGLPEYTTVKKSFVQRYGRFVRAILFNFVLGAMVETLLREVPDLLAGTGDDDDDEKRLKSMRKNILGNAMAGFPGINEGVNFLYESIFEKPSYMGGRGVGVLSGTVERYKKVVTDVAKLTQGKDSIDAIDLFRDVARAANTKTGMSDTVTDAIFNTVRFIGDDYQFDNMADLREYIAKTIFDRKLKKKK